MDRDKKSIYGRGYFEEGEFHSRPFVYNWKRRGGYFLALSAALIRSLKPHKALDIGCAKGYLVNILNRAGIDAYGVDVSDYAISQAPDEIKARLRLADLEREAIPFPGGSFDLVACLDLIEHLGTAGHLISEITRVLQVGGYLLVTTPTPHGRLTSADKTHVNVQSKYYWLVIFKKHHLTPADPLLYGSFKNIFLNEYTRVVPQFPPLPVIKFLVKFGKPGMFLSKLLIYMEYFSPIRATEVLLFKKVI